MNTHAERARRLLAQGHGPEMNRLAIELGLVTPEADAETVKRRLRNWLDNNGVRYFWMIQDGRAAFDIDRSSVLEALGEVSETEARRVFHRDWADKDGTLVRYRIGGRTLLDPKIIETA